MASKMSASVAAAPAVSGANVDKNPLSEVYVIASVTEAQRKPW